MSEGFRRHAPYPYRPTGRYLTLMAALQITAAPSLVSAPDHRRYLTRAMAVRRNGLSSTST